MHLLLLEFKDETEHSYKIQGIGKHSCAKKFFSFSVQNTENSYRSSKVILEMKIAKQLKHGVSVPSDGSFIWF